MPEACRLERSKSILMPDPYFFHDLRFSVLCFNHGAPITDDPHAALREVLRKKDVKGT